VPEPALPPVPPHLADPRALTILTTEHWGLLTARSLVYNETFSRGAMFLTFLSASLVALGFVAGSGIAGTMLPLVAIPILALDLFVGLATLTRLVDATVEEFVALQGMARLRHAYLEIAPDLRRYFSTATFDDIGTVLGAYAPSSGAADSTLRNVAHGLTTMPGMVMVIDAAIAGALAAVVAIVAGTGEGVALALGIVAGVATMAVFAAGSLRVFSTIDRRLEVRFPGPGPSGPPPADQAAPDQEGRRNT
jgi:hypothetical protein